MQKMKQRQNGDRNVHCWVLNPGGGGGYFRNFWVGMCRRDPGTLNHYQS